MALQNERMGKQSEWTGRKCFVLFLWHQAQFGACSLNNTTTLTPVTELVGTRGMKRCECFQIMNAMIDPRNLGNVDDRSIGILLCIFLVRSIIGQQVIRCSCTCIVFCSFDSGGDENTSLSLPPHNRAIICSMGGAFQEKHGVRRHCDPCPMKIQ